MLITTIDNKSFKAEPNKTILESALDAGLVFEYSCKNGQCGVCKTTLLEGEVRELHAQVALSQSDRENKQILTCCSVPKTDVLVDAVDLIALKGIKVQICPTRINKIIKKTDVVNEVELRLPPAVNFKYLEGQYIDVIGPNGIKRSYSIANSSDEDTITLWIKKVEHGQLSGYWFNNANKGDLLRIEGPKGTFFLRESSKPIVLLATGTGIAPIKAILDRMDKSGSKLNFSLYWGNRQPEDFFWQPNYQNLDLDFNPILSKSNNGWDGHFGYVQDAALAKHESFENTDVYACGSQLMIESAKSLFIKNGLEEKHFYSDAFVSS